MDAESAARVYGKTRKEVESSSSELRAKAETGVPITPTQLTLGTYLQEWLTQIVAQRVRPNTLAAYRFHVERYLVPDLGDRKPGRLTAREIRLLPRSAETARPWGADDPLRARDTASGAGGRHAGGAD